MHMSELSDSERNPDRVETPYPSEEFSRIKWARSETTGKPQDKLVLLLVSLGAHDDSLAYWSDRAKLADQAEMKPRALRGVMDRLCTGGYLVSIPMMYRATRLQTDNLYILNPKGWLDHCRSAEEIITTVGTRMDLIHKKVGNTPFPSWGALFHGRSGLRLPDPKISDD